MGNILYEVDCENTHLHHFDYYVVSADTNNGFEHLSIGHNMYALIKHQCFRQEAYVDAHPERILPVYADAFKHMYPYYRKVGEPHGRRGRHGLLGLSDAASITPRWREIPITLIEGQ